MKKGGDRWATPGHDEWQFVMLDSSVPGKVFGALAESELAFLSETLEQHPDIPAVIALHHHPVDIGSDWMEKIGLTNRDAFWQVLDRFPQVRIVLWGHIHQEHERERNASGEEQNRADQRRRRHCSLPRAPRTSGR